jgi:hypothetical protein
VSAPFEEPLFGGVEPRRGGGRQGQTGRAGGRFRRQGYGGGSFGASEIHQRRRRFPESKGERESLSSLFSARRGGQLRCVGGEEAIIVAVRPNGLPRVWLVTCSGSISVWWTARQRATTGIPGENACPGTGLVSLWIRSQCLAPRLSAARLPP